MRAMAFGRRKFLPEEITRFVYVSPGFLSYIYEKTRLPLVPVYGMFPVKMM